MRTTTDRPESSVVQDTSIIEETPEIVGTTKEAMSQTTIPPGKETIEPVKEPEHTGDPFEIAQLESPKIEQPVDAIVSITGLTETTETKELTEKEKSEETAEIIAEPSTTLQVASADNGNWGMVAIIILCIVAAGAALALILIKGKGMKKQRRSQEKNKAEPANSLKNITSVSCGMAQTIGKREQQQDSLYISNWKDAQMLMTKGLMVAVADGIGGLRDGNLASKTAMQAVRSAFLQGSASETPSDRLLAFAAAAQKSVLKLNETTNSGATLVSVLITGRMMHFLSIGDSRIYLFRAGALLQLNREHILRRENEEKNELYGTGEQLTKKRAGALTSYLGKNNLTQIDRSLQSTVLLPGDRIALMSDGVFNTLSEQEIVTHLQKDPESAANDMIQNVDQHNHPTQDNATVVVVGFE